MIRGIYSDPSSALRVLEAIGGAPLPRTLAPPREPQRYRGRCGNGAHPAKAVGRGKTYRVIEEGSDGCANEVADGAPPPGVPWSIAVAMRIFARTGEWPAWIDKLDAPRYVAQARDLAPVSNPLRLCSACIAKTAPPSVDRVHTAHGATYVKQPGLCYHGQRAAECWACPRT